MDKQQLYVYIAAILTTLTEFKDTAESTLYMLTEMDMRKHRTVMAVLTEMNWVKVSNHRVSITDDGREIAAKLNEVLLARQ